MKKLLFISFVIILIMSLSFCVAKPESTQRDDNISTESINNTGGNEEVKIYGCDAIKINTAVTDESIMDIYLDEYRSGMAEGYTSVILAMDDFLGEHFSRIFEENGGYESFRKEVLKSYESDGEDKLLSRANEFKEIYGDVNADEDEIRESIDKIKAIMADGTISRGTLPIQIYTETRECDLYIVKVPAEKPYEVFAWLPMGGWNECPGAEEMISISKYWFEKYGAVPAMIASDSVGYYLESPVTDIGMAKNVAIEHFAYCNDNSLMGAADYIAMLIDSNTWYFWWD